MKSIALEEFLKKLLEIKTNNYLKFIKSKRKWRTGYFDTCLIWIGWFFRKTFKHFSTSLKRDCSWIWQSVLPFFFIIASSGSLSSIFFPRRPSMIPTENVPMISAAIFSDILSGILSTVSSEVSVLKIPLGISLKEFLKILPCILQGHLPKTSH